MFFLYKSLYSLLHSDFQDFNLNFWIAFALSLSNNYCLTTTYGEGKAMFSAYNLLVRYKYDRVELIPKRDYDSRSGDLIIAIYQRDLSNCLQECAAN